MSLLNSNVPRLVSAWKHLRANCANPECRTSPVVHTLAVWKQGIKIEDRTYCSPACFEVGAGMRISELVNAAASQEPVRRPRMPLGLILLSRGCLNNEQLQSALEEQRSHGGNIGEILCAKGYTSERQVTAAAAAQWGFPVFSLQNRGVHLDAKIPFALLELYSILPVLYFKPARKLLIAFVCGVDHRILSTIEHMTQCTVEPCFITPSEYREKIRALADSSNGPELVCDKIASPSEMAGALRSYASEMHAEEARFGYCREYLWARLFGKERQVDILFRVPSSTPWIRC